MRVGWVDRTGAGGCSRYFGPALNGTVECDINLEWGGDHRLLIAVGAEAALRWEINLASTATTRLRNRAGNLRCEDLRDWPCPVHHGANAV